jgi:riboflavin biosynthesis pyrimidine reductase
LVKVGERGHGSNGKARAALSDEKDQKASAVVTLSEQLSGPRRGATVKRRSRRVFDDVVAALDARQIEQVRVEAGQGSIFAFLKSAGMTSFRAF